MRTALLTLIGCFALAGCVESDVDEAPSSELDCTVVVNADGTSTLSCEDGTTVTVPGGEDGLPSLHGTPCVLKDNDNGTRTIYCQDGHTFTIPGGTEGWSPVDRDPLCEEPDVDGSGSPVPWGGFEHKNEVYTCNRCLNGDALIQGEWRLVDFDTEDPNVTLKDLCAEQSNCLHAESVTFDGNSFSQHLKGVDLGESTDAIIHGWYFCSDEQELQGKPKVFVVSSVTPPGAFGFDEGLAFTANTLMPIASDNRLVWNYSMGVNEGEWVNAIYCRIGTTISTLAGENVPCVDPFE